MVTRKGFPVVIVSIEVQNAIYTRLLFLLQTQCKLEISDIFCSLFAYRLHALLQYFLSDVKKRESIREKMVGFTRVLR